MTKLQELWRETNDPRYEEIYDIAIKALQQGLKREQLITVDDTHDQCTECGAIFCITSNDEWEWEVDYCPNCGAMVKGDIENE